MRFSGTQLDLRLVIEVKLNTYFDLDKLFWMLNKSCSGYVYDSALVPRSLLLFRLTKLQS